MLETDHTHGNISNTMDILHVTNKNEHEHHRKIPYIQPQETTPQPHHYLNPFPGIVIPQQRKMTTRVTDIHVAGNLLKCHTAMPHNNTRTGKFKWKCHIKKTKPETRNR